MPAVLFELGFMDNNREALLMIDKSFQKECAVELAQAVVRILRRDVQSESAPPTISKRRLTKKRLAKLITLQDVQAYAKPQFGTQVPSVVRRGQKRNVYEIKMVGID